VAKRKRQGWKGKEAKHSEHPFPGAKCLPSAFGLLTVSYLQLSPR